MAGSGTKWRCTPRSRVEDRAVVMGTFQEVGFEYSGLPSASELKKETGREGVEDQEGGNAKVLFDLQGDTAREPSRNKHLL